MSGSVSRSSDRPSADGSRAAAREHARLEIAPSRPVDIFGVIEHAGIWLMFQPLDHLYGTYERVNDAAGIMINAKQPPSLQRFTAAHEYGHHVLGHATSLDDEAHILPEGNTLAPRENAAQTFAAHFLMPVPFVDHVLALHGLPPEPGRLTPREAYLVSLDLGVSYAAALNHLAELGKIDRELAAELRRYPPKRIKSEILGRARPRNDRADLWLLHEQDAGRVLYPRVNDELIADLPEIPSSGYIWSLGDGSVADLRSPGTLAEPSSASALALIADEFGAAEPDRAGVRYGGGGSRRLVFKVLRAGHHRINLARRRPWLPAAPPAGTWEVGLDVALPRVGPAGHGLSEPQKPLVAIV